MNLQMLGLSAKEKRVFSALGAGANTPLQLSRQTGISRPTIYTVLENLHNRGLIESRITNRHKHWQLKNWREIDKAVYELKRSLLQIPEGSEEIYGRADSVVIVHRGKEAIKKVILNLFVDGKQKRFFWGFQGDISTSEWHKVFTVAETNRINRDIKRNRVITEAVLPEGWLEEQTRTLGTAWARDFEGRTAHVNVIEPKYFKHGGQCWIFDDSLYLFSLSEELVIEIRNSEIEKMILATFGFMQDNSRVIDANEVLRKLIAENKESAG